MHPLNVELILGHAIGLSDSYYQPTEKKNFRGLFKSLRFIHYNNIKKFLKNKLAN